VGYFDWRYYTTFARIMKSAGYSTAIAGKWQINDFRIEPNALEKHGFDDWCMWTGYESNNPPSSKRYWDPYVHTRQGSKTHAGQFGPDIFCDFLIDHIKRHRNEPMMLYFPMVLTHGPLVNTPDKPDVTEKFPKHQAMVEYTDKLVGRLVSALDATGIRERSIIIFTTDNGSGGGVLGTIQGRRPTGGKASNYEGGVCEPFIVNCPGTIPEGVESDALTDFSDLLPTFAELGGAEIPADLVIDGHSIAPVMLGQAADSTRDWILAMGHGAGKLDEQGVRARDDFSDRVIRDKRFKLWVEADRSSSAFYDLVLDPYEKNNLVASRKPEHIEAMARLRGNIDKMPQVDARPKYHPRAANPWDRRLK
jgi:arylsulfatase A-like enzyme